MWTLLVAHLGLCRGNRTAGAGWVGGGVEQEPFQSSLSKRENLPERCGIAHATRGETGLDSGGVKTGRESCRDPGLAGPLPASLGALPPASPRLMEESS